MDRFTISGNDLYQGLLGARPFVHGISENKSKIMNLQEGIAESKRAISYNIGRFIKWTILIAGLIYFSRSGELQFNNITLFFVLAYIFYIGRGFLRLIYILERPKKPWISLKDAIGYEERANVEIQKAKGEIQKAGTLLWKSYPWYPEKYAYANAVDHFISYLKTGEAYDISTMIACYKNDKHHENIESTNREIVRQQKVGNRINAVNTVVNIFNASNVSKIANDIRNIKDKL